MAKNTETPKANKNAKFAGQRHNVRKRVVSMRTKKLMSWADIAAELEVAPRTARRIFQEAKGEHQHHDHLPNKGGRFPTTSHLVDAEAKPVLVGDGSINAWTRPVRGEATTEA